MTFKFYNTTSGNLPNENHFGVDFKSFTFGYSTMAGWHWVEFGPFYIQWRTKT